MKRTLGISALLMLTVLFVGCGNDHNPEEGLTFPFESMRHDTEIEFPPGDILEAEVFDNWVVLHYKNGKKFIVNRDQIWSITTK